MTPTSLCQLAEKYGTDKYPGWAGGTGHSYTPYYYDLLRDRDIKMILELGISSNSMGVTGPSLRMWAEFFPKAQVFGVDNCPWVMVNEDRIHSTFMDQSRLSEWDKFLKWSPKFDLIIDDGSHEPDDQILSLFKLYDQLSPTGIYVIEDVRYESRDMLKGIHWESMWKPEIVSFDLSRKPDDTLIVVRR